MSAPEETAPAPKRGPGRPKKGDGPPAPRTRQQKPQKSLRSVGKGASPEARKLAAAILEVLGGVRSTTDAAAALECSLPRYYQLEARAVEGLLAACEPKRPGRTVSPGREADELRRRCGRLEREVSRQQALVRAANRAVGLAPTPPPSAKPRPGKKRSKRPTARALVAASVLKAPPSVPAPSTSPGSPTLAS